MQKDLFDTSGFKESAINNLKENKVFFNNLNDINPPSRNKKIKTYENTNKKEEFQRRFNQILYLSDPLKKYDSSFTFDSYSDLNIIIDSNYSKELEKLGFLVAKKDEFNFLKIDINNSYKGIFHKSQDFKKRGYYVFGLYWKDFFDIDMRNHRPRYCYKIEHLKENESGIFMQLKCPIIMQNQKYCLAYKEELKKIMLKSLDLLSLKQEWIIRFSADPAWWSLST